MTRLFPICVIVDVTDEDQIITLGHFPSLSQAILALREGPCAAWKVPENHDDYFWIDILEYSMGWDSAPRHVYKARWMKEYDEKKDEYYWKRDTMGYVETKTDHKWGMNGFIR